MIAQATISVNAAKRVIAEAVYSLPEFRMALANGKVVLKGGTTVSALAELVGIPPLRISGRIADDGLRAAKESAAAPHTVFIDRGNWRSADETLLEDAATMTCDDVFVTGANALDGLGVAGLMAGSLGGGLPGRVLPVLYSEGVKVIIAVGLEKLIPGSVVEIAKQTGRTKAAKAMGLAVGVLPVFGRVVTEKEAVEMLTGVRATVIGAGGIGGGEGSSVLQVEGDAAQIAALFNLLRKYKKAPTSGDPVSLIACDTYGAGCGRHMACIYRGGMSDGC